MLKILYLFIKLDCYKITVDMGLGFLSYICHRSPTQEVRTGIQLLQSMLSLLDGAKSSTVETVCHPSVAFTSDVIFDLVRWR